MQIFVAICVIFIYCQDWDLGGDNRVSLSPMPLSINNQLQMNLILQVKTIKWIRTVLIWMWMKLGQRFCFLNGILFWKFKGSSQTIQYSFWNTGLTNICILTICEWIMVCVVGLTNLQCGCFLWFMVMHKSPFFSGAETSRGRQTYDNWTK